MAAYFDFTDNAGNKSFINERLLNCCNYAVDVSDLDKDREFKSVFKGLFRMRTNGRKMASKSERLNRNSQ